MRKRNGYIARWINEYDFRTFVSAGGSFGMTVLFALYNGFLGIYHRSLCYGTFCVYYLVLLFLRGVILLSARKKPLSKRKKKEKNRIYFLVSFLLLILNLSLILPISIMIRNEKPVRLTLIPAIAMAAYTTYKITMASINLRKMHRSEDKLVRLLRTIHFIDALVSILILQNTLIMVMTKGEDSSLMPLTVLSSTVVWIVIMFLSVIMIRRAGKKDTRKSI